MSALTIHIAAPVTAGAAFTVKTEARDTAGNLLATYNAPGRWSDLSGALSPTAPADFVNGISTTATSKVAAPFANDRVTVTTGGISVSSGRFNVR